MCIRDRKCSNIADRKTKKHAETYRIKEELKSLYIKKAYLNSKLYKTHLKLLDSTHPAALEYYPDFINRDIQPVSYTHLDVYKRQAFAVQ